MTVSGVRATCIVLVLLCASWASNARAYTFENPFGEGCHERLTIEALRDARNDSAAARPLPTSREERAWIDDLPIDLPGDARDVGTASLVAGVRHNDVKGNESLEPSELAHVHGNPNAQHEHCLRAPEHDGPLGTQRALAACRAYILERFELAVRNGFDSSGRIDPEARTRLAIALDFRGDVRVPMPTAYVELGQALHALQDSFSHAVRSEDGLRVRVLLNWVDYVHDRFEPARDGPAHREPLDVCEGLDELRRLRLQRAYEASSALLGAAFAERLGPEAKLDRARAVLDRYMSFEPGCDAANGYCNAPELGYAISDVGCTVVAPGHDAGAWALWAVAVLALALSRRSALRAMGAASLVAIALAPRAAAQDSARIAEPGRAPVAAAQPASPFAARAAISGSIDELGAAAAIGGRYALSPRWLIGLDAEWNPWASLETTRVRPGAFNAYATVVFRGQVNGSLALRVTGHAGISTLLFDMYGAPSGSVGPYLGFSLLGLEVQLGRDLALVLEPADVAVAIPHVTGIPYVRRQYRATVGVELRL